MADNPFFKPFGTPHDTVPFDRISLRDIEEAVEEGMRQEAAAVAAIADNPEAPTFENTIVALDGSGRLIELATNVMFNLESAESTPELQELVARMAPRLAEHSANLLLNERLFERVKAVKEQGGALNVEDAMLLEKTYEAFERNGATLNEAGKAEFRRLSAELSRAEVQFSQNHLRDLNAFELHITNPDELAGLPPTQVDQAAAAAQERGKEGWVFTLHAPSYGPFMAYAQHRGHREEMFRAYNTQCTHGDANDNFALVSEIVNLRRQIAQLLGYKTFADYVLQKRMAENVGNVNRLLGELVENYRPAAEAEMADVAGFARFLEGDTFDLQPWDIGFYSDQLRKQRFRFDAERLRPYLELSQVEKGVFGLATRLYGITFERRDDIPVYHPDVHAYDVLDRDGTFLAVLYCDFHPRSGKQSGAWMTSFKEQWMEGDVDSRPHVSLVMNFTKPTPTKPALLSIDEVTTFLHEFGHALHGIFSRSHYVSLSGTSVYRDFVELPSQMMENFVVEKDFLRTFAFHYQTGEPMPDDYIQYIVDTQNFNVAYACIRQVEYAMLDMAYYTQEAPFEADVRTFEHGVRDQISVVRSLPEACMSVQFGHIMSGGYAAGYYGYKWAEVLAADAFSVFQARGIFSAEVAASFRENILSRGGTEHPAVLYRRFRGQDPTIDALLRRNGIAKKQA